MSIPSSPLFGRKRVMINSKHATPELPVLQGAAAELFSLDEFGLLPAAAIDHGDEDFSLFTTPTTAMPSSPDEEESEHEVDGESPAPEHEVENASFGFQPIPAAVPAEGGYMPMWCSMQPAEGGSMMVVPVADGTVDCLPDDLNLLQATGSLIKLWCWVQPDGNGGMFVVPCTDRADEGPEFLEAAASMMTSKLPEWSAGPYWPFNSAPTTLEITSLPEDLTQEDFLEILDREEASGLYDFVFMPSISATASGSRFAVVNCTSNDHAETLVEKLRTRTFRGIDGCRQQCEVSWASVQGLDEMVEICRDAPENNEETLEQLRPQLFSKGWPVSMPRSHAEVALAALAC